LFERLQGFSGLPKQEPQTPLSTSRKGDSLISRGSPFCVLREEIRAMTAQQKAFEARFEDKLHTLMPYLVKTARGDEDLIQEGAIGIWESMKEQPYAATKFHATKAKWSIISVARGVGKSVDIPKQYPRNHPIAIIHYDAIPHNSDADLSQAILTDRNSLSLDEMVIRKMDFERFVATLTTTEERYVRFKMVDELPDRMAAAAMSMSVEKLHAIKSALRTKIEDHFTA
jgi:DNA-directed RNA polymerase specialized sigma24 family protein